MQTPRVAALRIVHRRKQTRRGFMEISVEARGDRTLFTFRRKLKVFLLGVEGEELGIWQ